MRHAAAGRWLTMAGVLLAAPAAAQDAANADPRPRLPPLAMAKAEWLLRHRLPCLGCHEVGGAGGRIGPSLLRLERRRSLDYVRAIIADPQAMVPGTVMPRVPMSPETRELIAGYLVQREGGPAVGPTPRPPDPERPATDVGEPAALYARSCAPCHGVAGQGDGYNARYLPQRPTVHADQAYMATRTDDALFDAIAAGGYVMDRSNMMPQFGATLTREQIRGLVAYLRTLCRCVGPAWSRDGGAP